MSEKTTGNENQIREIAKKSIKKKRDAWQFLVVTIVVNSGLSVIWASTGAGYFWPVWVIFGMGIGVVLAFADAYIPSFKSQISESQIDAEVERLKKSGRI
ncbi:MAG: hypothetical protein RL036_419 [Actinomycetota bacterium]|jgi:hypothetical protein